MHAAAGQIGPEQLAAFPTCFGPPYSSCDYDTVKHVGSYILVSEAYAQFSGPEPLSESLSIALLCVQICGIMAGMLLWGYLADITVSQP